MTNIYDQEGMNKGVHCKCKEEADKEFEKKIGDLYQQDCKRSVLEGNYHASRILMQIINFGCSFYIFYTRDDVYI